ncbi:MAG: hypothetical protein ACRC2T_09585, partial [Thermoguttaceae bacterium]
MKKTFFRIFQSLVDSGAQSSAKPRKSSGNSFREKTRAKELKFESLEDRCMLSADSITFGTPDLF